MEEQLSDYKSLIREFGRNLETLLSGENLQRRTAVRFYNATHDSILVAI